VWGQGERAGRGGEREGGECTFTRKKVRPEKILHFILFRSREDWCAAIAPNGSPVIGMKVGDFLGVG
jgi:hypothetical protein